MTARAPIAAQIDKSLFVLKRGSLIIRKISIVLLVTGLSAQGILADTITYQQLRKDPGGRSLTNAPIPAVSRTGQPNSRLQGRQGQSGQQPTAQESPTRPEYVRLPDGRIVRYGPGTLCAENCVDPVSPSSFRDTGPSMWWYAPIVTGIVLCAVLCRGDSDNPQATPTIVVPVSPTPTPSPGTSPTQTPSPGISPTPPPLDVPEPGTIVLVGIGLGAMLARRRRSSK